MKKTISKGDKNYKAPALISIRSCSHARCELPSEPRAVHVIPNRITYSRVPLWCAGRSSDILCGVYVVYVSNSRGVVDSEDNVYKRSDGGSSIL